MDILSRQSAERFTQRHSREAIYDDRFNSRQIKIALYAFMPVAATGTANVSFSCVTARTTLTLFEAGGR